MDYFTGILLNVVAVLLFWVAVSIWLRTRRNELMRAKLALVALSTEQAILLINREGVIEWVNNGFLEMSGLESSELIGRSPESVLMETMPNPKGLQHIRSGLASGKTFLVELLCGHKDGHRYWLALHFSPFSDESCMRGGFVVVGSDVTARKQVEEESLRVSRRNESLLQLMGEGIFLLDIQGNITYVNPAAARLAQCEPAELVGQPLGVLVHQLNISKISGDQKDLFLAAALQQGSVLVGEVDLFRRKDGSLFAVEFTSSPLREGSNNPPGAIVLFRDITERQRQEMLRVWHEQQTAFLADIMFAMAGGDPLKIALRKCAQTVVSHLRGDFARIWTLNAQETELELQVGAGVCTQVDGNQSVIPVGSSEVGLIAKDKMPSRIDDLANDFIVGDREWIRREQLVSFAGVPLLFEERLIGVLAIYSKSILPPESMEALQHVAESLARGIVQKSALEKMIEQAALLDKSQDAIVVMDLNCGVTFWNKSAERLYGWAGREVLGRPVDQLIYRDASYFERASQETIEKGEWKGESCQVNKGDGTVVVDSQWTLIRDDSGRPKSILMVNTDVTEKKKIEAQFLRTQRMESIGTLAGGIAHDLNNVLAPILMSAEIMKTKYKDEQTLKLLSIVESSAKRGADMVKQVLTFSRGVDGERVLLQTRHLIKEVIKIVGETLPKTIQIKTQLADDLWPIMGDATQLHQVLVNLVVNARDAMPKGGALTLSAENAEMGADSGLTGAKPGFYVLLKVSDTGTGIPPEIRDKIFEPFFTTKEMGKGTGLGLATVLGIVKSHSGYVQLQTEVNKGTTFLIYLPASQASQGQGPEAKEFRMPTGRGELILAVDDEASVLTITKETLETYGYRVLTAKDGTEAVAAYSAHRDEIKGVLTDMLMPYMDGPATIRVLKKLDPQVKIIAASGLMDGERVKDATGLENIAFLMKPYTTEKLLQTVHNLLHEAN